MNHHYLMLKKWHPSNRANLTKRYQREQEENDRKRRETAAVTELEKRREKFLFDKMVEMRDGKTTINEKEMDLDFMYAVPNEIKEQDKQLRSQGMDEEATKFMEKYVNKKPIVTEQPEESEKNESSEDEQGNAKDPRKDSTMAIFENQIKEGDGHLNYDRAEELARLYRGDPPVDPALLTKEEKKLRQFSTQAMQISKGLYLRPNTPIGGNIDPSLNTFIESSSDEHNSDEDVINYLKSLTEEDKDLLLRKLQGKESRRHRHKHKHRRHSYNVCLNKQ